MQFFLLDLVLAVAALVGSRMLDMVLAPPHWRCQRAVIHRLINFW